jgi:phosphoribosyl-ATP pyrophosphohydrolase/phosphoribosyl-AMP cyclohydrolase
VQQVVALLPDCDGDAVLARVAPAGPACHTGTETCFGTRAAGGDALTALEATVVQRMSEAMGPSHTQRLLTDRNLRLKKIGEEAGELIAACADGDRERATQEMADLLYHALVAVRAVGGSLDDVRHVLAGRRRQTGGAEPGQQRG